MNSTLMAIDDGLANGHLDLADVLFLIATVLGVLAVFGYAAASTLARWAPPMAAAAIALIAFGLFWL